MRLFILFPCSVFLFSAVGVLRASAGIERTLDKTFAVAPGSIVEVDVSGAPIRATVGAAGTVGVVLKERFKTDDAAEADALLERYDIVCEQSGDEVKLVIRSKRSFLFDWRGNRVSFAPEITVPADVRLDLNTSGGSITVAGKMTAAVRADTSGGSIRVDEGSMLYLDTSGGGIRVGRATGKVLADTSGGSITVDYVGPAATDVNLDTSGGSIHVGIDPAAALDLVADTSGGSVRVDGFEHFEATRKSRTHVEGRLNGGGGRLRADTSGGSIKISPAAM